MVNRSEKSRISYIKIGDPHERVPLKDRNGSNHRYLGGLGSFRPIRDLKLHFLPFIKGPKSFPFDSRVMYEDVTPFISLDEAIPLLVIKPFYPSFRHTYNSSFKIINSTEDLPIAALSPLISMILLKANRNSIHGPPP